MANTVEILITGKNLTKPEFDAAVRDARTTGEKSGKNFGAGFRDQLGKDLPGLLPPVDPAKPRVQGQATGKAFAGGMSPLILGAFAAIASVGPAAVLGATALAVVGAGALITKGNQQMQESYAQLGQKASAATQEAAAPLIPALMDSVQVLEQGIGKIGPELGSVFSAVAPMAAQLTGGLVSLVSNTLPGVASGLKAIAPFAQDLATDFGKIGTGLGGFFAALGSGASGGMAGFTALVTVVEQLLPDIGQIIASLSNGLGPALGDIVRVAVPVADALTNVVNAFPPKVIEDAAVATAALFAAFKIGGLVGAVAEGTTFLGFIKGAIPAEAALATETSTLSASFAAMLGPIGAVVALLPLLTSKAGTYSLATADMSGKTQDLSSFVKTLGTEIKSSGDLGRQSGQDLDLFVRSLRDMQSSGADVSPTLSALDAQMLKLKDSNPALAAQEYARVLKDLGLTAQQGAAEFPRFAGAVKDLGTAGSVAAYGTIQVNNALATNQIQLAGSAQKAGQSAVAALSFASAQGGLNEKLAGTIADFELAKGASSAYKTALDALYGKYQSYADAQAVFTTALDGAKTGLKGGKDAFDLNTAAGSANEAILSGLVTANANRAAALLEETGNQQLANQALQAGAVQIDNMARSAHFTQKQIDALNLALYGTKNIGSIQVPIGANTKPLYDAVGRAINWANNQIAYIQVAASGTSVGGRQLLAHGGIAGAAAGGGPRSNLTWVGEHGPELIPLQPGTMVHSNPDSMRMAAEAGRGGGGEMVVRLEVTGDDLIAQWIRNHVRVVAGNSTDSVQRAFGQTY